MNHSNFLDLQIQTRNYKDYKKTKIQKYKNTTENTKIQKEKYENMKIKRSTRHQAMLRREKGPP